MNTSPENKLPESNKAAVRKVLLGSSLVFLAIGAFCVLSPAQAAQILDMDEGIMMIFAATMGLVAIADFIIAFTVFKPKDRV